MISRNEVMDIVAGLAAGGLGAYLMTTVYQCDVIVCAMFLTGQASNPIIARFAQQVTGIEITYARWVAGSRSRCAPTCASRHLRPGWVFRRCASA